MNTFVRTLGFLVVAGCAVERAPSAAPATREAEDCVTRVREARRAATDSLFVNARGLVESCPEAMTLALTQLWKEADLPPVAAHHLRGISALLRDGRLVAAVEAAVRDPARPVETRIEALSTLSYYLEPGKWVEFTFLSDHPDSASLRMFQGSMENPLVREGSDSIPAGFPVAFRQMLETLRGADTSSAIRSAARRFLVFLDYLKGAGGDR